MALVEARARRRRSSTRAGSHRQAPRRHRAYVDEHPELREPFYPRAAPRGIAGTAAKLRAARHELHATGDDGARVPQRGTRRSSAGADMRERDKSHRAAPASASTSAPRPSRRSSSTPTRRDRLARLPAPREPARREGCSRCSRAWRPRPASAAARRALHHRLGGHAPRRAHRRALRAGGRRGRDGRREAPPGRAGGHRARRPGREDHRLRERTRAAARRRSVDERQVRRRDRRRHRQDRRQAQDPADELAQLGYAGVKMHTVAGKCGVFAETDINGLQKQGAPAEELMASLFDAIVLQNLTVLSRGHTLPPRVLLLGGPHAFIRGLREAWQRAHPAHVAGARRRCRTTSTRRSSSRSETRSLLRRARRDRVRAERGRRDGRVPGLERLARLHRRRRARTSAPCRRSRRWSASGRGPRGVPRGVLAAAVCARDFQPGEVVRGVRRRSTPGRRPPRRCCCRGRRRAGQGLPAVARAIRSRTPSTCSRRSGARSKRRAPRSTCSASAPPAMPRTS